MCVCVGQVGGGWGDGWLYCDDYYDGTNLSIPLNFLASSPGPFPGFQCCMPEKKTTKKRENLGMGLGPGGEAIILCHSQ